MARTEKDGLTTDRLTVEEAKQRLRMRSDLASGPRGGVVGTALDSAKRQPFKAAAVALALGIAFGASRRTRRTAVKALRRVLGSGL